jgi:hypothetical protein
VPPTKVALEPVALLTDPHIYLQLARAARAAPETDKAHCTKAIGREPGSPL